jgi:hypothetical protein
MPGASSTISPSTNRAVAVRQQHVVDFLRVVVARRVVDDHVAAVEPGLGQLDPLLHGPLHDPDEQVLDRFRVLGVVPVLVRLHPLGVQPAVRGAQLEVRDAALVELLGLAVELGHPALPARADDRDHDLGRDVAAEQQRVRPVELRGVHELAEAHQGTVQVRGEEHSPLALAARRPFLPAA